MKKINIPLLSYQDKGSYDCVIHSFISVMSLFKIRLTQGELLKNDIIKRSRNIGINYLSLQQIGIIAKKIGFQVKLETSNSLLITKNNLDGAFSIFDTLKYLKKGNIDISDKQSEIKMLEEFLDVGGEIIPKLITIKNIEQDIDKGIPLITIIDFNFIYSDFPGNASHAIIIIGYDNDNFIIFDPIKGEVNVKKDILILGIITNSHPDYDNAGILKIYEK